MHCAPGDLYLAQVVTRGRDAVNRSIGVDDFWDAKKIAHSRKEFTASKEMVIDNGGIESDERFVSERERKNFVALTENDEGPRTAGEGGIEQDRFDDAPASSITDRLLVLAPSRQAKKIADSRNDSTRSNEFGKKNGGRESEERDVSEWKRRDLVALNENFKGPGAAREAGFEQASKEYVFGSSAANEHEPILAPSRRRKFAAYLIRTARSYSSAFMSSN